jgi:nickel/cobalt exporter
MLEFVVPAFLLGLKHSFDADHLLAVSNFLTRSGSPRKTLGLTTRWTVGHMGGAALVTAVLYVERDSVISLIAGRMDMAVALMLVVFGLLAVYQSRGHSHTHRHGGVEHEHPHGHARGEEEDHSHIHMFGIGLIQGLASNDELLLLLTVFLGLSDIYQMMAGVAVFSAGVFAGMNIFGLVFTSAAVRDRGEEAGRMVNLAIGLASIGFGLWMLSGYLP